MRAKKVKGPQWAKVPVSEGSGIMYQEADAHLLADAKENAATVQVQQAVLDLCVQALDGLYRSNQPEHVQAAKDALATAALLKGGS